MAACANSSQQQWVWVQVQAHAQAHQACTMCAASNVHKTFIQPGSPLLELAITHRLLTTCMRVQRILARASKGGWCGLQPCTAAQLAQHHCTTPKQLSPPQGGVHLPPHTSSPSHHECAGGWPRSAHCSPAASLWHTTRTTLTPCWWPFTAPWLSRQRVRVQRPLAPQRACSCPAHGTAPDSTTAPVRDTVPGG